ncbi:hypothetical protein LINPERPRIM_LOCUS9355 [Linum perenne]
MYCNGVG